jgi:hypothetical protein
MSLLSQIENVFETIVEGSFRRFLAAPLQPIEIARALERAMEAQRVVGAASVDVPNQYVAYVNPTEFQRLEPLRATVERDAAVHIERRASELNYRPIAPVHVTLSADPKVSRATVRAEARFDEGMTTLEAPVEHTRRLELVRPDASVRSRSARSLVLVNEDGETITVDGRPLRIGRGPDNDLVVPDIRISRYHAVIEPVPSGWIVRDLDSTNGTFLDGDRVSEAALDPPAALSLGGYQFTLRAD